MSEVKRTLLKAAQLLENQGWCQHLTKDHMGRRCALGALEAASGNWEIDEDETFATYAAAAVQLRETILVSGVPGRHGSISAWNDSPTRTAQEVIATFRAAAAKLEES